MHIIRHTLIVYFRVVHFNTEYIYMKIRTISIVILGTTPNSNATSLAPTLGPCSHNFNSPWNWRATTEWITVDTWLIGSSEPRRVNKQGHLWFKQLNIDPLQDFSRRGHMWRSAHFDASVCLISFLASTCSSIYRVRVR